MKKINLTDEQIKQAKDVLSKFKDYDAFSDSKNNAYSFTKIICVKVCPYCNINYIYTVFSEDGDAVLRPDIDHYFCKSKYKKYQLCLYNLIPSCMPCNERLKGSENFMKTPYLHPYFHDFHSIMRFSVSLNKTTDYLDEDNIEIFFVSKSNSAPLVVRAKNNIKIFKLVERYQYHKDQVVDLFKKSKYYWKAKRDEISRLFSKNSDTSTTLHSYLPLESILFSEKDCDINQVSLGKLKKDIINYYCLRKNTK